MVFQAFSLSCLNLSVQLVLAVCCLLHYEAVTKSAFEILNTVAAGTAFSGYAFSFTHESSTSSSPTSRSGFSGSGSIHMMGKWEGSDPGIINQKTPSTLLLTPQGQFHSFGFTARNFYHDLTSDEARNWLFFDKFKMCLYESSV